jgi:hypothetical protein
MRPARSISADAWQLPIGHRSNVLSLGFSIGLSLEMSVVAAGSLMANAPSV